MRLQLAGARLMAGAASLLLASHAFAQGQGEEPAACRLLKQFAGMSAAEVRTHAGAPAYGGFSSIRSSDLAFGGPCTIDEGSPTSLTCVLPGFGDDQTDADNLVKTCLSGMIAKIETSHDPYEMAIWLNGGGMLKVYASGKDMTFKFVY